MNLHEYQAKEILKKYGIAIPRYGVASSEKQAVEVAKELGLTKAVIKIQVHAGGRGKAGGVRFAKSSAEIAKIARELIGMKMVNNQTGPSGVIAHQVLISEPMDIAKEYYLGAIIDREKARPILIASAEGGMDIEELAVKHPDKLLTLPIQLDGKMRPFHLLRLVKFFQFTGEKAGALKKMASALAKAFIETDGSLLEINPLVEDPSGHLWALDAKLSIDDNALFRQKEIANFYDPTQQSDAEVRAKKFDLAYVSLDGDIGCMVNGAGLAMATMDIIQYYGGKPANFLDVGGSASKEKVAEGFRIIVSDPKVKVIFVNIFGGIMNCAVLAEGIVSAMKEEHLKVPLVVRMEGTNVHEGKKILKESGLPIITAENLAEGAKKAVNMKK